VAFFAHEQNNNVNKLFCDATDRSADSGVGAGIYPIRPRPPRWKESSQPSGTASSSSSTNPDEATSNRLLGYTLSRVYTHIHTCAHHHPHVTHTHAHTHTHTNSHTQTQTHTHTHTQTHIHTRSHGYTHMHTHTRTHTHARPPINDTQTHTHTHTLTHTRTHTHRPTRSQGMAGVAMFDHCTLVL